MDEFYVYIYIDPRTNQPFYVGKGVGNRAYENYPSSRNDWVYKKVKKILSLGYLNDDFIQIHTKNLSEDAAFVLEDKLILRYGKVKDGSGILLNINDGGNQPPSRKGTTYKMSEKARINLKKAWTEDRRHNMSKRLKGKSRPKPWINNISASKRNKNMFDVEIFEKYVKDGFMLNSIIENMNLTYDIIKDRIYINYGTKKFKEVKKMLKVENVITERQQDIDLILLEQLTNDGCTLKDILKIMNIGCSKTIVNRIKQHYGFTTFSEYKNYMINQSKSSSSSSR